MPIYTSKAIEVKKGWGKEVQIQNLLGDEFDFPRGYSGKLLVYEKAGAVSSNHFHMKKDETFYVLSGDFLLKYYDLQTAEEMVVALKKSDCIRIPPGNPHQLICLNVGVIIEFATADYSEDNYRIGKGDSQKLDKEPKSVVNSVHGPKCSSRKCNKRDPEYFCSCGEG